MFFTHTEEWRTSFTASERWIVELVFQILEVLRLEYLSLRIQEFFECGSFQKLQLDSLEI